MIRLQRCEGLGLGIDARRGIMPWFSGTYLFKLVVGCRVWVKGSSRSSLSLRYLSRNFWGLGCSGSCRVVEKLDTFGVGSGSMKGLS